MDQRHARTYATDRKNGCPHARARVCVCMCLKTELFSGEREVSDNSLWTRAHTPKRAFCCVIVLAGISITFSDSTIRALRLRCLVESIPSNTQAHTSIRPDQCDGDGSTIGFGIQIAPCRSNTFGSCERRNCGNQISPWEQIDNKSPACIGI